MSQLQKGRAVAKRIIKKPKTFAKAQAAYDETFNDKNKVGAEDAKYKPMYSRVTHKLIAKKA